MAYEENHNNMKEEEKEEDNKNELDFITDEESSYLSNSNNASKYPEVPESQAVDENQEGMDINKNVDTSEKAQINKRIENPMSNINSIKGFEIISESLTDKVYQIFGRNSLLSILYQVGAGPGNQIAKRIKEEYDRSEFEIIECLEILMKELKEFYSIQIREIERNEEKIRIEIENHCFLRDPFKDREKLQFGKVFCRINKGYFETAFKQLLGNHIKKVEINFIKNDPENDVCIEELIFHKTFDNM